MDETSPRYAGWRVAAASSVGVFVGFASLLVYTFGIFLRPIADEFGWSREAVSTAFGIAAMTVAVCSPGLGYLLDRLHPRQVIVPCVAVFGLGFASLSLLTPNLWHLYAVFFAIGVVGNGTAQMAYARAVSGWFEARRGTALAVVMAGGAVGAMVLPPVAEALIRSVGWRTACLSLGLMTVVVGVPGAALFIRERPGDGSAKARGAGRLGAVSAAGASVRDGLSSRVFWILVVVLFFSSIAQNAALTHLPSLLADRGVSTSGAALALSALGAASLVGRLATGWMLDRFFAGRVAFMNLAVAAAGAYWLAGSLGAGVMAAVLIGFGMGGEADVTPYALSRYFGLRSFSVLYGFTWTFYAVAGALGPVLMGRAFDLTGSYQTFLVQVAAGTLAVATLMLLLPRYAPGRPR